MRLTTIKKVIILSVLVLLLTAGALEATSKMPDPALVSQTLKSIYDLISRNKLPEALRIVENALQKFGEMEELLELKYNLLMEQEKYPQALELVNQQLKKRGNLDHLLAAKLNVLFQTGNWNEALKTARLKYELARSKSPWDCLSLTRIYIKLNRFPDALNALEEAVSCGFIHYRILGEPEYAPLHKENRLFEIIENIKISAGLGKPLPKFTSRLLSGEPLPPSILHGKVTLIFFWATWCRPCKDEIPNLLNLYKELAPKGFDIIAISLDSQPEAVRRYVQKNNIPWKQACTGEGWKDATVRQFSVSMVPSLWLADKKGFLRSLDLKGKELADAVKVLLEEK